MGKRFWNAHRAAISSLAVFACMYAYLIVAATVAYAAGEFVPLAETPGGSKLGVLYTSGNFSSFINGLFKFAVALGAIAAVLRLAYAGYLYMGQSDMWSHKGEAKTIIKDVTIGLLLLLSIYLILFQINPDILTLKALGRIKPVEQTTPTQSNQPTNGVYNDPNLYGCSSAFGCGGTGNVFDDAQP